MNKPYIIAFYIRISVEDEDNHENGKDESNSVTNQRDLLYDFVESYGEFENYKIIELCDDGYSGTNFERPAVKKLLEQAKTNKVDCIIVKDFSRFGRDYLTVSDYVDQIFPFLGVRFVSINDHYDSVKCYGATSGVDIAFRNIVYSYYSKDISQKVRSGKRSKALRGDYLSPFAPIGYQKDKNDKNKLLIEEQGAEIVRRIFQLAGTGMSTVKIARLFNAEKVPTPSQLKNAQGYHHNWWVGVGTEKLWDHSTIRLILRDERYLGKAIYGKRYRTEVGNYRTQKAEKNDWIVVCDTHEPIVTEEEFKTAEDSLGEYRELGSHSRHTYLFTDKLRCGVCGYSLMRKSKPTPRYLCETKYVVNACKCMIGHIKENEIADVVLQSIRLYAKVLLNKNTSVKQNKQNDRLALLKKQVATYQSACGKFKEQKAELYDCKADGKITLEQYLSKCNDLSKQQSDMEHQMKKLTADIEILERKASIIKPREHELKQCLEIDTLTREMVLAFVDCIYVYSDKSIRIKWLFDEKGVVHE